MSIRLILISALALISLIGVNCSCGDGLKSFLPKPKGETHIEFTADRTSIKPGEHAMLQWKVQGDNFFGVVLNGQPVNSSGQQQVSPPISTIYNIEVDIGTTMLRREVTVEVAGSKPPGTQGTVPSPGTLPSGCAGPPHVTIFEVVPASIQQGQTATLNWGPITNGADGPLVGNVTVSPGGSGNMGSPGSIKISPTTTTTYTLTAAGCAGIATASVTLAVIPAGSPTPQIPPGGNSWSGPMIVVPGLFTQNPPGGNSWGGPGPFTPNPPGGNSWGGPNSPGTIYDFMQEHNCYAASWYAYPFYPYIKKQKHPNDIFPATWVGTTAQKDMEYYEYSYTRWLYDGDKLEDGSFCSVARPALLMRPPWDSSSKISGTYKMSNYTIGEKDYVVGKVGYINGVVPGLWVTADFKLWVDWTDNSPAQSITLVNDKNYTGNLESFKISLGNIWKGRSVSKLGLELFTPYGTQDMRTVWVETKLVRE